MAIISIATHELDNRCARLYGKLETYSDLQEESERDYRNSKALMLDKEAIMPGITLRYDGRYMIRKMQNGIRKTIYANTIIEAKKILIEFKHNRIKVERKNKKNEYTIETWLNEWLSVYKKNFVKKSTYSDILIATKKINAEFGTIKLDDITTKQVQEYLNTLQASRSKELLVLYFQSALNKALELKITTNNFFIGLQKDKKIKNKRFAFNYAEQCKIMKALDGHERIKKQIYFYLFTGARKNELIKDMKDIDLENNLITIHGTKTDKSEKRVIECTRKFILVMQNYLFSNKIISCDLISKEFIEMCREQGIENPSLHRLRHTFATNHYVLGTRDKQIQEWLGHESIDTTMNIYTDIDKTLNKDKLLLLYNGMYFIKNN